MLATIAILAAATGLAASLVQISAAVGFLLPLLVSVIQREHWSNTVRTAVGIAACAVAAVVTAWAQGKLNFTDWTASVITIFLMTKTSYLAVWKPTGVAPTIEHKTS